MRRPDWAAVLWSVGVMQEGHNPPLGAVREKPAVKTSSRVEMNISDQSQVQNMSSFCIFNAIVTCTCSGISLLCSSVILTRSACFFVFVFYAELIWNMAKVKWLFFRLLFYTVVAVLKRNGKGELALARHVAPCFWRRDTQLVLFWRIRTRNCFVAKVHFVLSFVKSCTGLLFKNVHTVNCCFYEYLVSVQTMYRF